MGFFSSIGNFFKDNVGSVLGFAGDVASGLLGLSGTKSTNETEAQLAQAQMAYQKELAKNQIQWRVEDAKKAGLHPLAALGVSSASYSPVSTDLESPDYSFLGDMGQNLNRSIMEGKTAKQRQEALDRQKELDSINIRKAKADADLAETTAASERLRLQRELFPPSPVANQASDPQLPKGPQVYNAIDWAQNGGYYVPTLSEDAADRTDDDPWAKRVLQGGTLVEYIDNHPDSRPPAEKLSPADRKRLASGHFHWVVHPFGLRLEVIPGHEKFVKWRNKDGSVGGKLYF